MKEISLGKTISYGWFDDLIHDNFQYDCESCGKSEKRSILVAANTTIDCQHLTTCTANNVVDNCERCSINKLYPDAWKQ